MLCGDFDCVLFIVSIITLRLTQILALAEILLLSLTWKTIVDSSKKMKKVDTKGSNKFVIGLVVFLLVRSPERGNVIFGNSFCFNQPENAIVAIITCASL